MGTTGYTPTGCTLSSADNKMRVLTSASAGYHYAEIDVTTLIQDDRRYYFRVTSENIINGNAYIQFRHKDSYGGIVTSADFTPDGRVCYGIIYVSSLYSTPSSVIRLGLMDSAYNYSFTGTTQEATFSEVMLVDLTEHFGIGNEPTSPGQLTDNISDWFTGTETIYPSQLSSNSIQGQWYGTLNGSDVHIFASGGHVYQNNGDGTKTDLGTLTDAKTEFFQFVDTLGLENYQGGDGQDIAAASGNTKIAQTFTATRDLKFTSCEFMLRREGTASTRYLTAKLWSVAGGVPSAVLATSTNVVYHSALTTGTNLYNQITFYFDEYDLVYNTQYAISLESNASVSATVYFRAAGATTNVYSGGSNCLFDGTNWATTSVIDDLWFKINAKPVYSIYILNGVEYKKWTGYGNIATVDGYVPITYVGSTPDGTTKTAYEQINNLTGKKRVKYVGVSGETVYYLPETSIESVSYARIQGINASSYTVDEAAGTVTFSTSPSTGMEVEIKYNKGSGARHDVVNHTNFIKYGGKNDDRVFLYGDGNRIIFSDLADTMSSAEYFPALNYLGIQDDESNVIALQKQYDRLIIHKENRSYWSSYDYDNTLGASFPVYPLNDSIGCSVKGCGQVIQNNPRVIYGNKVYDFVASNVRDERNVVYKSLRVQPLLDAETLSSALTFDNEADGEYWIVAGTKAYIHNYTLDVWYYYLFSVSVTSICKTADGIVLGTSGGQLMLMDTSLTDNGTAISAFAKTGFIDYGTTMYRKFVTFMWANLYRDGSPSGASFYYETDSDAEQLIDTLSYTTETKPVTERMKPKMKKFVLAKFIIKNDSTTQKCKVLGISAPAIIGGITK